MEKKIRTQSGVADVLGISRQAVSKLIKNRDRTGIPIHNDIAGDYWYASEVSEWYKSFTPGRGPKSGIKLTDA